MTIRWTDDSTELYRLEDRALRILGHAAWRRDEPLTQVFDRLTPSERDELISLLEELLLRSSELPRRLHLSPDAGTHESEADGNPD